MDIPVEEIEPESLAAFIINQKYVLSVPHYRLEQDFKQYEALITRATMARCAITCADKYFRPMFNFFHRELLKRKFIMMDESPIQVLKEPERRAQSKSYFWITRTGEDGRCSLSNNNSENSIRPVTVGRKTGFFLIHKMELKQVCFVTPS